MTSPFTPFLREYATDIHGTEAELTRDRAMLERIGAAGDEVLRVRLLGRIGEGLRVLGRLKEAVEHLSAARAAAARLGDPSLEVITLIRLATALQYQDQHVAAARHFRVAIAMAPLAAPDYHDVALQHYGKCLVELRKLDQAQACFERALTLRIAKGDADLINATHEAMAALAAMRGGREGRDNRPARDSSELGNPCGSPTPSGRGCAPGPPGCPAHFGFRGEPEARGNSVS